MARPAFPPSRGVAWLCALALWLCLGPAWAQSRAWLDRDRITLDETVVLFLDIDINSARGLPDLLTATRDFHLVDQRADQQMATVNGEIQLRVRMALTLQPKREGEITIPRFRIGRDIVGPLRLTVLPSTAPPPDATLPAEPAVDPTQADALPKVFIDGRIDTATPYVQQTVGYTATLYYEMDLMLSGGLDQDPPEGARLQPIGEEAQPMRQIGNRLYNVVERRYLLIPQRSGAVTVPGIRFNGRGGRLFGRREAMRMRGRDLQLQVQPIPAGAMQPWLPLRGLRLRWLEAPRSLRVGEAARITVEAVADGAVAAQLPALNLQIGDEAQLFPEAVQPDERFVDGRSQVTAVRSFSVLPGRDGTLRIAGPRIAWWDVQAGIARTATLPDLVVPVAPAAAAAGQGPGPGLAVPEQGGTPSFDWRPQRIWLWALLPLSALCIVSLVWGWRMWSLRRRPPDAGAAVTAPTQDLHAWTRALQRGDRAEIARLLCRMATPPAADLDEVRERLADATQREAVAALQRARWGRGDPTEAIAAVRTAFPQGPRWRSQPAAAAMAMPLPPLYPR
jgi:hypothetical protein